MNADYSKYKLGEELHNRIFDVIEQYCFGNSNEIKKPTIIIIAGQPGAGKGRLIETSMREITNPVIINGDEFRKFHPSSNEIITRYNKDYAMITDADVRTWTEKLLNKAINDKYNCIFECTLRTNQICNTIKRLKSEGFFVNLKVMAVNELDSRLGIYQRYERQVQLSGNGRYVPIKCHDDAYTGMLSTLHNIEEENLVDLLQVYTRDGQVVYQKDSNNTKMGACDVVSYERNKEWDNQKKYMYLFQLEKVIKSMKSRNEKYEMIKEVEILRDCALKKLYQKSDCELEFMI